MLEPIEFVSKTNRKQKKKKQFKTHTRLKLVLECYFVALSDEVLREFETCFIIDMQKSKSQNERNSVQTRRRSLSGNNTIMLLDVKRAQNIAITIARIKNSFR